MAFLNQKSLALTAQHVYDAGVFTWVTTGTYMDAAISLSPWQTFGYSSFVIERPKYFVIPYTSNAVGDAIFSAAELQCAFP